MLSIRYCAMHWLGPHCREGTSSCGVGHSIGDRSGADPHLEWPGELSASSIPATFSTPGERRTEPRKIQCDLTTIRSAEVYRCPATGLTNISRNSARLAP